VALPIRTNLWRKRWADPSGVRRDFLRALPCIREFHHVNTRDATGPLFAQALVAEGMTDDTCWIEDVAGAVERARKQSLPGITLYVCFEKTSRRRESRLRVHRA
jgi:hypothetical protein